MCNAPFTQLCDLTKTMSINLIRQNYQIGDHFYYVAATTLRTILRCFTYLADCRKMSLRWCRPYCAYSTICGDDRLLRELRMEDTTSFFIFLRMQPEMFDELL